MTLSNVSLLRMIVTPTLRDRAGSASNLYRTLLITALERNAYLDGVAKKNGGETCSFVTGEVRVTQRPRNRTFLCSGRLSTTPSAIVLLSAGLGRDRPPTSAAWRWREGCVRRERVVDGKEFERESLGILVAHFVEFRFQSASVTDEQSSQEPA